MRSVADGQAAQTVQCYQYKYAFMFSDDDPEDHFSVLSALLSSLPIAAAAGVPAVEAAAAGVPAVGAAAAGVPAAASVEGLEAGEPSAAAGVPAVGAAAAGVPAAASLKGPEAGDPSSLRDGVR